MRRIFLVFFAILCPVGLYVAPANSQVRELGPDEVVLVFPIIRGFASVIDGDTLRVLDKKIRLHGIDAPERKQTCSRDDIEYWCGFEAYTILKNIVRGRAVECVVRGEDSHGRLIATCSVDGTDLGREMVRHGWAMAYTRYSKDYIADEDAAKAAGLGIWQGNFTMPWIWRKSTKAK